GARGSSRDPRSGAPARTRRAGQAACALPSGDARGRVPERDRPGVRGRRRRTGGGVMTALRLQGIALLGVVERNTYLIKRYGWWELAFFVWTIANTLTVTFIADGIAAGGGTLDVERQTTILLIGAVI